MDITLAAFLSVMRESREPGIKANTSMGLHTALLCSQHRAARMSILLVVGVECLLCPGGFLGGHTTLATCHKKMQHLYLHKVICIVTEIFLNVTLNPKHTY